MQTIKTKVGDPSNSFCCYEEPHASLGYSIFVLNLTDRLTCEKNSAIQTTSEPHMLRQTEQLRYLQATNL